METETFAFALKTFEIFEELTTTHFPKGDVKSVVKDKNGFLTAKYELTGESKKAVEWGSFVENSSWQDAETTCGTSSSCGNVLSECLKNGQDGLISNGAGEEKYYATCQD